MNAAQDYQGRLATAEATLAIAKQHLATSQQRIAVVEAGLARSAADVVESRGQLACAETSLADMQTVLEDELDRSASALGVSGCISNSSELASHGLGLVWLLHRQVWQQGNI